MSSTRCCPSAPAQTPSPEPSGHVNLALCNSCGKLVPATRVEREGCIYLAKACGACGTNETLISSDAVRYWAKHRLDLPHDYRGCGVNCASCTLGKQANMVFVDVTNRCNLNCPICINNTPSMGFLFEPPLAYFDAIFSHFGQQQPRPAIQLFGGEPTVRADLLDIIRLGRSYGLSTRLVTNGIALADEAYCRQVVASRATVLFAYDNDNEALYQVMRGSGKILALKLKALDNLARIPESKVVLMSLVAKGFNDQDLPRLFDFCHARRHCIRGIYFMPLTHTWAPGHFALEPQRITSEDVEQAVATAFPDVSVDFLPAGLLGQFTTLLKYLKIKPLPFAGAHPNCESMYLLISDGRHYTPLNRYLRGSTAALMQDLIQANARLAAREQRLETSHGGRLLGALRLRRLLLRSSGWLSVGRLLLHHVRLGHLLQGRGPGKLLHWLALTAGFLAGRPTRDVLARHARIQGVLQLIVLPFEDQSVLETERLERCPSAFAYYDPAANRVRTVSTCAWPLHKTAVMQRITAYYAGQPAPPAPPSAASPG